MVISLHPARPDTDETAAGTAPVPARRAGVRLWPRSLAGRTALTLLLALAVVQALGLTIHAFDRIDLQRLAQARDLGVRVMSAYRVVATSQPGERPSLLRELQTPPILGATVDAFPTAEEGVPLPSETVRNIRLNMALIQTPPSLRPRESVIRGVPNAPKLLVSLRLPDGAWLNLRLEQPSPRWLLSATWLIAFVVMTVAAAALTLWAVRTLTAPVRTLAAAAEALGRDVNAPPLPEDGPAEVATAAAAFNTMAARIRRFVQDRTFLLTAIGHDLRTPITRLKLRTEFIEDEEQRRKMLADLDELEAMVTAVLSFGRDLAATEPVGPLDLAVLLRTVLDETADARPDVAERLTWEGPEHLAVRARPIALKRAFANLVNNAVAYGGAARVSLHPPSAGGPVRVEIDDDGPGIPAGELDRIFEPFHRVEPSRNRETGGVGLGLPIARSILRAHGGDVALVNRPGGGARAIVTLPP